MAARDPNVRSGPPGKRKRRVVNSRGKVLPLPPGLAKKAAGVQSARDFAPGRANRPPAPPTSSGNGRYGSTNGIPNAFPASTAGKTKTIIGTRGGASGRRGGALEQFDGGKRTRPGGTATSPMSGGEFDGGKRIKPTGIPTSAPGRRLGPPTSIPASQTGRLKGLPSNKPKKVRR